MVIGADDTIAGNDSLQVVKGRASSLDVSVLLGNDAGATGETLTVTGVFNAVGAAVSLVAGKLVIIASQATGGFDYTVTTSGGGTASGHVDLSALTPTVRLTATAPAGVTAVDYVGANAADKLTGGDGADRLVGAGGADKLDGGAGADRMEGGAGADTYRVDNAGDQVVEADDPGADTVVTALASYTLGDFKENLTFDGTGSFIGTGNASRNTLISRAGSDSLFGGDGVDTLIGGAGDDLLDGGTSLDTVSYVTASVGVTVDLRLAGQQDTVGAGRGADTFVFQALSDIADGDLIADFSQAQGDIIDLSAIDADATVAGQQTFTFIGTTTFSGAAGAGCEIRFEAGSGRNLVVQGDVDHDGLADFQFLVTTPTLAASDFDLNP